MYWDKIMILPYYSIYEMIGKYVNFKLPAKHGGDFVKGYVSNVFRDTIKHLITIQLKNDCKYVFSEPDNIVFKNNLDEVNIIFIYGSSDEVTDDEFFEECKKLSNHGYGVEDVFKQFDNEYYFIIFKYNEIVESEKENIV